MSNFSETYARLNKAQREAVDTIDGPVLVIAGPGTGKTQLLGARVANILEKTDTPAQNILCLTFTENGAANMRERLTKFIGQAAYDVTISTYHAFGSDLISRYPEYFMATRLQNAVDDLGKRQILGTIVEAMSYKNPLKQTRHHIGDLMSTVSEVKRAMLTSKDLRLIALQNAKFIVKGSKELQTIWEGVARLPGTLAKSRPYFEKTLAVLAEQAPAKTIGHIESLAALSVQELRQALDDADAAGKSTPLTEWKNNWLAKDAENRFVLAGALENARIAALADVVDSYQKAMAQAGLYDYDDMILRSIQTLEKNADLRYTLQERYLYILLDEFQDTNASQLRLVQLLTENPVNEGRPNIMAVGDDDQAIYAFQGAQYSNMLEFYEMFRDTRVVSLTENYRSHPDILHAATNIVEQIEGRLQHNFEGMTKQLKPARSIPKSVVERREFMSDIAERAWIAQHIKKLIKSGTPAREIAVLAPKHKYIEPLVAYLNAQGVPVHYEKRENVLDAPVVRQLITMSRLLVALRKNNEPLAASMWPEVLSYEFWKIPTDVIWRISWQVSDSSRARREAGEDDQDIAITWSRAVLDSKDQQVRLAGEVLLSTAVHVDTDSSETILDFLIGSSAIPGKRESELFSPLKDHYTSRAVQRKHPEIFYETVSHLTTLRARFGEYQARADNALMLADFLSYIDLYEAAEQPMIDTSPYSQQADSVQLLTVFKAKGLEYEHVFLVHALDDVWGGASRGNSNKLTLPPNLQPIRHAGATHDERLRILFVAMTRAKSGLYLTSASRTFTGKVTKRLKYFNEQEQDDGTFRTLVLPESAQLVVSDPQGETVTADLLELDWRTKHIDGLVDTSLHSLLKERLENYRVSPTSLVSFLDLEYAGPGSFYFYDLLKFPSKPSFDSSFGSAMHETLQWYQYQLSENGIAPSVKSAADRFAERMRARKLPEQREAIEIERGQLAIAKFLKERGHIFKPGDVAERTFRNENVFVGDVHLSGQVDRMEIDKQKREITVVDYKTGKSYSTWRSDIRLYRYKLQLYAYKLLIERSRTYQGYKVVMGRLEFIESDEGGRVDSLELTFNSAEQKRIEQLIQVIWKHIQELDFPDTSEYPQTMPGIRQFEDDLLA